MDSPDAWLLPGEQTLWTGRPVDSGVTLAEAGYALYLVAALTVATIFGLRGIGGWPGILHVMVPIVWGACVLQVLGMLVNLLVIAPRAHRRSVYEVTNYRIAVTRGQPVVSVYLDQTDEPVVRRNRNGSSDLVVGTQASGRRLAGMFASRGLGLVTADRVTKLPGLADADNVRQVIASARQAMMDREIDAPVLPEYGNDPAPPTGVSLGPGERVLWTGAPASIPWWFGGYDVYFSAFMLVWLAGVAVTAILVAQKGPAAFLVFLVPFALIGGVYPAAGRLVHRRLIIRRSRYVLTSRRLITIWQPLRRTAPVVVQESLSALFPPTIRGTSVFTSRAPEAPSRQRTGWKELTWPATTAAPPAFIGLEDPRQVCELIGAAQLAGRVPKSPGDRPSVTR